MKYTLTIKVEARDIETRDAMIKQVAEIIAERQMQSGFGVLNDVMFRASFDLKKEEE